MTTQKIQLNKVMPVLMSFFVMSFIDLVGTGVDELKKDATVPQYILQLIPFVAFIWFFILSVPVGIWQDKVGKKKALNIGLIITAFGLFIPLLGNSLPVILMAFATLGIGNTILQVSANPLLVDVVPSDKSSSFLSLSQFFKSIGSMIGPVVAAVMGPWIANLLGDSGPGAWRYGLYLFGAISLLSVIWLSMVQVDETKATAERASFASCFKLLGNSFVLIMVLGIFAVVGIDVAINSNIGTFLTEKLSVDADTAKYGKSVYFLAKMVGTFIGAILLVKWSSGKFLLGTTLLAIAALLALTFAPSQLSALIIVFIVSLGVSNIFPLIFSITVGKMPNRANEISGLMMMAISGGAVFPFFAGYAMTLNENGGVYVMLGCAVYILFAAIYGLKGSTSNQVK